MNIQLKTKDSIIKKINNDFLIHGTKQQLCINAISIENKIEFLSDIQSLSSQETKTIINDEIKDLKQNLSTIKSELKRRNKTTKNLD